MSTIRLERLENPNTSAGGIDIDSSGRVGIGTTTPGSLLELSTDATSAAGGITVDNTNAAGYSTLQLKNSGASGKTYTVAVGGNTSGLANKFYIYDDTAAATRCVIDSSGNFGIGTSNVSAKLHVQSGSVSGLARGGSATKTLFESSDAGTSYWEFQAASTASNNILFSKGNTGSYGIVGYDHSTDSLRFYANSAERMRIGSNGYIYADGVYNAPVGGTTRDVYVENNGNIGYLSSIKASKTNISDLTEVDWLWSLSPKTFNYRVKDEDGNYTDEANPETQYGLIAEEVEQVVPGICFYNVDEEGTQALAGVQYSKLITPLLKALQQANARIETLEAKVAALESTT